LRTGQRVGRKGKEGPWRLHGSGVRVKPGNIQGIMLKVYQLLRRGLGGKATQDEYSKMICTSGEGHSQHVKFSSGYTMPGVTGEFTIWQGRFIGSAKI